MCHFFYNKKYQFYFTLLVIIIFFSKKNYAQSLYDLNQIQDIKITFPFSNWDQKMDSLHTANVDARLIATKVDLNGTIFDSVGIRYKGNSTYNPTRVKNPLNIKLDFIRSSQNYENYTTLKLSNGFMDPSLLREVMGYMITRQYMPAPKANFIKLTINGTYIGLYTNVENISKDFVRNNFYSSDNAFFQCDRPEKTVTLPGNCAATMQGPSLTYISKDSNCYKNTYEIESDYGWADLSTMIDVLNNNPNNIHSKLDVDRALWMLALNNYYVNLDSYSGSGHNYLIYKDNNNRFNTIMWDLNEFYGAFANSGAGNLNLTQMIAMDPLLHLNNISRPLISKIMANPSYKKRYLAHLRTIMDDAITNKHYSNIGTQLQQLITAAATQDNNKFFPTPAFISNLQNDYIANGPNGKTYPGLISLSTQRNNFLSNNTALNVSKPIITNVTHPAIINKNTTITINAKIDNQNQCKLFYRFNKENIFVEKTMFDDGLHNDGQAGDKTFGASIDILKNTEIQYYIYAENQNIATLSPARAEFEFYEVKVNSSNINLNEIIINEAMSSNTAYTQDAQGDYDDWIELYNASGRQLELCGWYLSDDRSNLNKYQIPDTSIQPNNYLVIWADEDGSDRGLHANFKISKSGENIYFGDGTTILDSIVIPTIKENHSYGRCNNSSLEFSMPSIGRMNNCATANSDLLPAILYYPNPFGNDLYIDFLNIKNKNITIQNVDGKILLALQAYDTRVHIETQTWPSGIYFMQCTNDQGYRNIIKFIKP